MVEPPFTAVLLRYIQHILRAKSISMQMLYRELDDILHIRNFKDWHILCNYVLITLMFFYISYSGKVCRGESLAKENLVN